MKGIYLRPHFYSIAAIVMFSTIEVVGKLIDHAISPYAITAWRFFIGGLILLPYAVREIKDRSLSLQTNDFFRFSLAGVLVVCISMLFLQLSVTYGKAALSAVIVSSNPLFVTIFAFFFLKERISKVHIAGLLVGVIGLILIISGEEEVLAYTRNPLLGVLFGLSAAVTFAIYTVYSKILIPRYGSMTTLSFAFIIGAVLLSVYSFIAGEAIFFAPDLKNITAIAYLSIFVTGIAYILYFKAITHLGAARASLYFFLKPAVATFLSWLLLREMLEPIQIAGIALIMLSLSREPLIGLFNVLLKPKKAS